MDYITEIMLINKVVYNVITQLFSSSCKQIITVECFVSDKMYKVGEVPVGPTGRVDTGSCHTQVQVGSLSA